MTDLGTLVTGNAGYSFATATSGDGSVVVGATYTNTSIDHAFRWTAGGGMVDLGTFPGVGGFSDAFGVSADGNTVVGWSTSAGGPQQAFRWDRGSGLIISARSVASPAPRWPAQSMPTAA